MRRSSFLARAFSTPTSLGSTLRNWRIKLSGCRAQVKLLHTGLRSQQQIANGGQCSPLFRTSLIPRESSAPAKPLSAYRPVLQFHNYPYRTLGLPAKPPPLRAAAWRPITPCRRTLTSNDTSRSLPRYARERSRRPNRFCVTQGPPSSQHTRTSNMPRITQNGRSTMSLSSYSFEIPRCSI